MRNNSKNIIFWFFSIIIVLTVTYGAYQKLIPKSRFFSNHARLNRSQPLLEYSKHVKQYRIEKQHQQHQEKTLNELYANNLKSSHYSDGGNWRFITDGFLSIDLNDFIHWIDQFHFGQDPMLLAQKEKVTLLKKYIAFMETEEWLVWIQSLNETPGANFKDWQRSWRILPADVRQNLHYLALNAKEVHHVKTQEKTNLAFQKRIDNLFEVDDSGHLKRQENPLHHQTITVKQVAKKPIVTPPAINNQEGLINNHTLSIFIIFGLAIGLFIAAAKTIRVLRR